MSDIQQRATLTILLATLERALEALEVAGNVLDRQLVTDVEKLIARTRRELATLNGAITAAQRQRDAALADSTLQ